MESAFDYLTDRRDRSRAMVTPTLLAPAFGVLPALALGAHRFVLGANGLFIEARTAAIAVCARLAPTPLLPYGRVEPYVRLPGGRLPYALYERMRDGAVAACPQEWAGLVSYDPASGSYVLDEPAAESRSSSHIRYTTSALDYDHLVLDVHSHGHGEAAFSPTDDADDQYGIYLATVLGHCGNPDTVTATTRIVVHGHHIPVSWSPWASG